MPKIAARGHARAQRAAASFLNAILEMLAGKYCNITSENLIQCELHLQGSLLLKERVAERRKHLSGEFRDLQLRDELWQGRCWGDATCDTQFISSTPS